MLVKRLPPEYLSFVAQKQWGESKAKVQRGLPQVQAVLMERTKLYYRRIQFYQKPVSNWLAKEWSTRSTWKFDVILSGFSGLKIKDIAYPGLSRLLKIWTILCMAFRRDWSTQSQYVHGSTCSATNVAVKEWDKWYAVEADIPSQNIEQGTTARGSKSLVSLPSRAKIWLPTVNYVHLGIYHENPRANKSYSDGVVYKNKFQKKSLWFISIPFLSLFYYKPNTSS